MNSCKICFMFGFVFVKCKNLSANASGTNCIFSNGVSYFDTEICIKYGGVVCYVFSIIYIIVYKKCVRLIFFLLETGDR